jgi:hypothetical protein
MQGNERVQKMSDTYGHTLLKQLASYDQNTLSWKTCEDILASDLRKFSATLPKMGTMLNGVLFELVMSAHPIKEQDCSLLPTPLANDAKISYRARNQMSLSKALLPTPTVTHVRNHDEPIEVFMDRQARSSTGQIGKSVGLALRLQKEKYRLHWLKVN